MTGPPEMLSHGQVSLRRWRPDDAAALLAAVIASQEHLRPWMPWADRYDEDRAAEYLRECDAQWASGSAFAYAIIVGDQIVGSAGLHNRVGDGGLEIGYWVHGDWTGRGIATDATAALTAAALALPGIDRVEIYHDAANAASGRIPAKLGYARLGERPTRDLWPAAPGETGTDVVWQFTRQRSGEWHAQLGAEPWRLNVVRSLNILRSVSLCYPPIIPESTDWQPGRWRKILKCVLDY